MMTANKIFYIKLFLLLFTVKCFKYRMIRLNLAK